MHMRKVISVLPLVFAFACESASADEISGTSQALGKKQTDYEKLYDRFEGKYNVASMTATIVRTGGLAGDPIPADFYYPDGCSKKDGKGPKEEDKKWKDCHGKGPGHHPKSREDFANAFPIVPLLQGGNVPRAEYSQFATELASFGFVVVVPDLKRAFGPPGSPEMYLTSQWVPNWVAADLAQRDADPSSALYEIVDTDQMGLLGHSFGAAAALATVQGTCQPPFCFGPPFAYQRPAALKAAVVHGFQNCDPSHTQCFYPDTSAAPTMIVNGGLDDPGAPALEAYNNLKPARALVTVENANHFGLTNDDMSSPTGPNPEPNGLEQCVSISRTARWTAIWLSAHLFGDEDATSLAFESGGVEGATVLSEM